MQYYTALVRSGNSNLQLYNLYNLQLYNCEKLRYKNHGPWSSFANKF